MFRYDRLGAVALATAGILFAAYPATRPWSDESTVDGARAALGSGWWVASHFFAILGFILVPLGLLALAGALRGTGAARLALVAAVGWWIGAGLVLPYYGAEDFGLHALAGTTGPADLLSTMDDVRYQPVAMTTFGVGLVAIGVCAILVAVAVRRGGVLAPASGIAFAAGFALFLPQFFTPAPVRVAHGILVGVGCAWLALALWRAEAGRAEQNPGTN